jgi:small-conductance mechanosensitive channel
MTVPAPPAPASPAIVTSPDAFTQLRDGWDYLISWLIAHSGDIALAAGAGALIYLVLRFARRMVRRAAAKQVDHDGFWATTLRVLARTRHFFLIMVSIRLVVGFANPPLVLADVVRFLFVVAAAFQVAIWAREVIMSMVRQRAAHGASDMLANALSLINVLVSIGVFAIAAIVVLDNLGVNVTALVAGLGIGGIAIGLAAKGVFEDLFSALAIIFDRPFRRGDVIGFDQFTATVERIGLKSTRLRSLSGEEVIVSNMNLLNKEVKNFASVPRRRLNLDFGVTFETPVATIERIPEMVREIVEGAGHTLIRCGLMRFGASSLDFELQFDVFDDDYNRVFMHRHAIGLVLMQRFAAEGISFAYPAQVTFTADPDGTLISPWPPVNRPGRRPD